LGYKILVDNIKLPPSLKRDALNKHLRPISRLGISKQLCKEYNISAMMDITDGLIQDGEKLALASKLKIQIEIEKLPDLSLLQKYMSIDDILSSGEELELLFLSKDIIKSTKRFPVNCIGNAMKGEVGIKFNLNGKEYKPKRKGFLHF
jgi:thiamine-monophosphate kinase